MGWVLRIATNPKIHNRRVTPNYEVICMASELGLEGSLGFYYSSTTVNDTGGLIIIKDDMDAVNLSNYVDENRIVGVFVDHQKFAPPPSSPSEFSELLGSLPLWVKSKIGRLWSKGKVSASVNQPNIEFGSVLNTTPQRVTRSTSKATPQRVTMSTSSVTPQRVTRSTSGATPQRMTRSTSSATPQRVTRSTAVKNNKEKEKPQVLTKKLGVRRKMQVLMPHRVYLLRGNHESKYCTAVYGFEKEVAMKYRDSGKHVYRKCLGCFEGLPLASIIAGKVYTAHGGLFRGTVATPSKRSKKKNSVSNITASWEINGSRRMKKDLRRWKKREIEPKSAEELIWAVDSATRMKGGDESLVITVSDSGARDVGDITNRKVVHNPIVTSLILGSLEELAKARRSVLDPPWEGPNLIPGDVLWSDPSVTPGLSPNKERGIGLLWGPDCTEEFLKKYNLKLIIRSHEGPDARDKRSDLKGMDEGYTIDHIVESGKLITLFSAPDYPQFQATETRYKNKGAYIVLEPPHFDTPVFRSFEAVTPRPKVNPYYDFEEVIDSDEELDMVSMVPESGEQETPA